MAHRMQALFRRACAAVAVAATGSAQGAPLHVEPHMHINEQAAEQPPQLPPEQPRGQAGPHYPNGTFDVAAAVPAAALAGCRGGFVTSSGLSVTLGLERIVTVDGQVAARSRLDLGDLGRLAGGATTLPAGVAVQAGAGLLGGTFIQNSLSNQVIAHATVINASVSTHGMLQAMNFQSTLATALNTAATAK